MDPAKGPMCTSHSPASDITLPLAYSALGKPKCFCNFLPVRSHVALPAAQQWILPLTKHFFCLIKLVQHELSCQWVQQSLPHLGGGAEQQHCQFW